MVTPQPGSTVIVRAGTRPSWSTKPAERDRRTPLAADLQVTLLTVDVREQRGWWADAAGHWWAAPLSAMEPA